MHCLKSREINGRADRRAKQLSRVTCISENMTCWGAWRTTYRHKAKVIILIDKSPEGERRTTSKPFTILLKKLSQRKRKRIFSQVNIWNCFKVNTGNTTERRGAVQMGFSERVDTIAIILNWTEPSPSVNLSLQSFECVRKCNYDFRKQSTAET